MIDIGERAGSGIPNIFTVWNRQSWPAPKIEESFEPERITLSLQIEGSDDKSSDNDKKATLRSQLQKEARARRVLFGLLEDDIILAEGANRNRIYKLKQ